jgi:hypothetical protein
MIKWPYKFLVGFPGDARHVNWSNDTSKHDGMGHPTCEVKNPNKKEETSSINGEVVVSLENQLLDRFGLGICTVEKPCLFNLANDPLELDNLLSGHLDENIMMQANGAPTSHFDTIHK